jgi:general secretion pathway protein G
MKARTSTGFTIVELLIVIVVIGILATLVIGMISGAQRKARNAKTIVTVKQYASVLQLYKANTDEYPTVPDEAGGGIHMVCLGKGYPDQKCGTISGVDVYESDDFMADLQEVASGMLTSQTVNSVFGAVGEENFIGAAYGIDTVGPPAPHTGYGRVVEWFLEGENEKCTISGSYSYNTSSGNTACELFLEAIE